MIYTTRRDGRAVWGPRTGPAHASGSRRCMSACALNTKKNHTALSAARPSRASPLSRDLEARASWSCVSWWWSRSAVGGRGAEKRDTSLASRAPLARTPLSVFNICFSVQSMKRQTQQTERLGNTYMATSRTCAATIDGRATRACETICVRTCNCLQGKSSDGVLHNVCDDNDRRGVLLQVARRDDVVHPHGNLGELEREKYP